MKHTIESLVVETALYFNLHNRGLTESNMCTYFDADSSRKCAVGRCLTDDGLEAFKKQEVNLSTVSAIAHELTMPEFEACFMPEYRDIPLSTWGSLQTLHDCDSYWEVSGISDKGIAYIRLVFGEPTADKVKEALKQQHETNTKA